MKPLALLAMLALCAGIFLWQSIYDTDGPARTGSRTPSRTKVVSVPVVPPPHSTGFVPPPAPALEPPLAPVLAHQREGSDAVAARRDRMQARFAEQAVDASWASTATQVLSDDLAKHLTADVRVASVECRTTLCRADVAPTTPEAGQEFVQTWIRYRSWTGRGFAASDGDRIVVFVARPDRGDVFAN